jgi:hypothetical protein
MTGVEPFLTRAAMRGAVKSFGWGSRQYRGKLRDRAMMEKLSAPATAEQVASATADLPFDVQVKLALFIKSAEVERVAYALASTRMLTACGVKRMDNKVTDTRREFQEGLRLAMGSASLNDWLGLGSAIFDIIDAAVATQVAALAGQAGGAIPPSTRVALVKSATGIAAASVRNASLLEGLRTLDSYREFERQFRAQIMSLHGTMRLPHAGTSRRVPYERLFVTPTVRPVLPDNAEEEEYPERFLNLAEIMGHCLRTVMLGDPGAGKSTSSLKLAYDLAAASEDSGSPSVPVLVILRDYVEQYVSRRLPIIDWIASVCKSPYGLEPPEGALDYLLLNGRALVIFDGLDELLDTSLRREVVQAVEGFAFRYPSTPVLVTSRRVGYEEAPLDPDLFTTLQLQEFSRDQVEAYVRKWFSLDDAIPGPRKSHMANAFLKDSEFVDDLRANPLMLSLMCGIYASESYIPRNRPDVYEKCALLLFDRWDKQRGINAPLSFDAHVQAAMRSLALWLYPRQQAQQGLPRHDLVDYMKTYLLRKRFDDEEAAEQAATEFIDFCKGRAWVLTDVGAELYGFTHRTFLEYFAASQLVRLHPNARALLDELWPHIVRAEWDVVAQLALQILGKSVEDGADDFLELLLERTGHTSAVAEQSGALSFACRALAFIVPRPPVLRSLIDRAVDFDCTTYVPDIDLARSSKESRPLGHVIVATAENLPLAARYYREALLRRLSAQPAEERALLLGLHPASPAHPGQRSGIRIDRKFWEEQAVVNRRTLAKFVSVQKDLHSWVAARLVEEGGMTCAALLRRFGVRALYDFHQAGDIIEPPIAYKVLQLPEQDREVRWHVRTALIEQLHQALTTAPTPWLGKDAHYNAINFLMTLQGHRRGAKIQDQMARGVVLLLAMPIYEIQYGPQGRMSRTGGRYHQRGDVLDWFSAESNDDPRRRPAEHTAARQRRKRERPTLEDLQLRPEVASIVGQWLSGRVNFVGYEDSGLVVGSPRVISG